MKRQYSWPDGHWNWPVKLSHKHGVRAGQMIYTGGQVDLDTQGTVRNPGNVTAQCTAAMTYLARVLDDLGADLADLVKLVVYYVGDESTEPALLDQIATIIGGETRPVINMICLPELCYPAMMIEIEGVAMRSECGSRLPRQSYHLDSLPMLPRAFAHVVKCNEMIFTSDISAMDAVGNVPDPGDVAAQTRRMMDQLGVALETVGADYQDVLKLNVYYTGGGTAEDWEVPALIRASYFQEPGPVATGMPLEHFPSRAVMTRIFVTAMRAEDGARSRKTFSWPDGHWNWTAPLPYRHGNKSGAMIHVGGQVSLDGSANVLDPGDMVAQTRRAMENVRKVLADLGAGLDDVVKVTTFYQGNASAEALHENLMIRSNCYSEPGPATTGVPMPALVYKGMMIEIEVTAVIPE